MSDGKVLVSKLYPKISSLLDKNQLKFKKMIGSFIEARAKELFEIAPYYRIPFTGEDEKDFYKSIGITEQEILDPLSQTYYYPMANFNPRAAKDPLTVAMIMVIRYFILKKKQKEIELSCIYLSFSGKFYPSIHFSSFQKVQPIEHKSVMEFVVNNKLSQQFDLKREGSLVKAIKSRAMTWIDTYQKRFKECDDEDMVYLIQQLHDRIKSFMHNIAEVYYEVYDNKDSYLNFESDSLNAEDYRIADNDMYKIERAVEKTMNKINGVNADYTLCKLSTSHNEYVRTDELKNIVELILQDNHNITLIKELTRLLITVYFQSTDKKDLTDITFLSKSISLKPNTKDKYILRQKEIVNELLDENSPAYRRRKKRLATRNSYNKALLSYFTLLIYNANK